MNAWLTHLSAFIHTSTKEKSTFKAGLLIVLVLHNAHRSILIGEGTHTILSAFDYVLWHKQRVTEFCLWSLYLEFIVQINIIISELYFKPWKSSIIKTKVLKYEHNQQCYQTSAIIIRNHLVLWIDFQEWIYNHIFNKSE